MPGDLEEEPLVGIHQRRFIGRDAKEHRIEAIDVAQKSSPTAVAALGGRGSGPVGFEEVGPRPAAAGDLRDAVAARAEVAPELFEVVGLRVAAGHTDDGDVVRTAGNARQRARGSGHSGFGRRPRRQGHQVPREISDVGVLEK
jgi:hypothetical protein